MGLPAGQYSMQCWNSTQNPGDINRSKLLFRTFQLIKALQQRFTNGEIAVPSTSDPNKKGIEICILYRAGATLFADIASFLTETAASLGSEFQKFVKQDAGLTRYFNQSEMDNVGLLDKPVPDSMTEDNISATLEKAKSFTGFQTNSNWRDNIPADQRVLPFQITRTTLQKLHSKEGDDLGAEIRAILEAIQAANAHTNSGYTVINMIAKGAIALAGVSAIGTEVFGSIFCVLLLWNAGFFTAALVTGGILLTVAALLTGGAYLMLKDASNVLLVVNDTPNDLLPKMEWIENGERRVVPEMIPAAVPNSDFVSCGLFFYSKYQVKGISFGSYGSAFGVSFIAGNQNFSIGMDCPNSLMGGNNSIEVHNQEHAKRACEMALDSGCMHGWTDSPWVDVKIADHWGNVNWGRAVAMQR